MNALVFGYVLLCAAIHRIADAVRKPAATVALVCIAVFSALIFFNYLCQTTFVPALARAYQPEYAAIIATFSLANPRSLAWAIEMWGYAFLGLATWIMAGLFRRGSLERAAAATMVLNGVRQYGDRRRHPREHRVGPHAAGSDRLRLLERRRGGAFGPAPARPPTAAGGTATCG
jgi:hypothetical protein